MFKLFVFAAILAIAAAKPGLVGAPSLAYSAPLVRSSYAAPLAYSAGYAAPLAYSAGYSAGYASPYAYSAGYASPYAYSGYLH